MDAGPSRSNGVGDNRSTAWSHEVAEDSLVTTYLPMPDFIRAQSALAAFDEAKVEVDAAFWFLEDDDEWFFYVHTTLYDLSPQEVYAKLLDALNRFPGSLPLEDI